MLHCAESYEPYSLVMVLGIVTDLDRSAGFDCYSNYYVAEVKKMKIKRADGYGQGQCALCAEHGRWNRQWMTFLYVIEGKNGLYCENCVKVMKKAESDEHYRIVKTQLGSIYGSATHADTDYIKEEGEHGLSDANNSEDQ